VRAPSPFRAFFPPCNVRMHAPAGMAMAFLPVMASQATFFLSPSQVLFDIFASHRISPNSRVGRPTDAMPLATGDLAATWRPAGAAIRAPSPPSHAPPPLARYSALAATGRHVNVNRRRAVPSRWMGWDPSDMHINGCVVQCSAVQCSTPRPTAFMHEPVANDLLIWASRWNSAKLVWFSVLFPFWTEFVAFLRWWTVVPYRAVEARGRQVTTPSFQFRPWKPRSPTWI
jgi:hypothetical protein